MDGELIYIIIIVVITIISGMVSSKKKKDAMVSNGSFPTSSMPYAPRQIPQPMSKPAPKPVSKPRSALGFINQDNAFFEEGQRVTQSKKAEERPIERTGLHNRENLKRAIIFGEILAPKF